MININFPKNLSDKQKVDYLINEVAKLNQFQKPQQLVDAATIIWNYKEGYNAYVTLTANRTLSITGLSEFKGEYGTLKVIQGGTGSYTLALPAGSKVGNTGGGTINLSTAVGSYDLISFYRDELGVFNFNITKDFT